MGVLRLEKSKMALGNFDITLPEKGGITDEGEYKSI